MEKFSAYFSLFASTGTLFCCALPSLLVALGLGATMAGLVSTVPEIVWLSQYKIWVFTGSGFMIVLAGFFQYQSRNAPCPIDEREAKACMRARKFSKLILAFSAFVWFLGAFFAFLAPLIF